MAVVAAGSHRRILVGASLLSFGGVFLAFLTLEQSGVGIGHFFYLSIALMALAAGPVYGALAGLLAAALYTVGILLNPGLPAAEALTAGAAIRLVTYTGMGVLVGWFAQRNFELVERLRILAERDFLTGLPNTRGFELAIARRLATGAPFALLLGDMDGLKAVNDARGHAEGNEVLQRLSSLLGSSLLPEDELARVGGDEFAVLTSLGSSDEAAQLAARLECVTRGAEAGITFGWSVYPRDGREALSLFRAADERLYARKFVRAREEPTRLRLAPPLHGSG
jgi:diguanylate cyclase (GGDEF)-like protein